MASKSQARWLALIDRVAIDHVPVTITKRGRPAAGLVAAARRDVRTAWQGQSERIDRRGPDPEVD